MKRTTLTLTFLLTFLTLTLSEPCGRCVGKGQICIYDSCAADLKCTPIRGGGASVCMPVRGRNQTCNDVEEYDPCEIGFACDRADSKVCLPTSRYAGLGDNCMTDGYCLSGLVCRTGRCVQENPGNCNADDNCGINEICAAPIGGGNFTCDTAPKTGQSCAGTSGKCAFGSYCDIDTLICKDFFSLAEGAKCQDTLQCTPGLQCYNVDPSKRTCVKPKYHYVSGPLIPVSWGPECIFSYNKGGCTCNTISKVSQYLKETIQTFKESCKVSTQNFKSCIESNKCFVSRNCYNNICSPGADTCVRNKCYQQYINVATDCTADPGLVLFCGASSLTMFLVMILFFMLL